MNLYYTDGSANPNPGRGGWAVVLFTDKPKAGEGEVVASGAVNNATNIRMEGYALGAAIKEGEAAGKPYKIITDSQFWCNVLTKWAPGWEKRGWKKATSGEIQNLDLVQKLYELYKQAKPQVEWTRGHVGDPGNEAADEAANRARQQAA
ncbi:ribonuclease HI [Candidatus Saccharibacteria bacterium]|nr:ribonuclease HI [Candidatus Saccharibacteria bacterium]